MAVAIFSEVLCFLNKNIKRFDKGTLHDIIAKFYHDDELYEAKSELCKVVAALQPDASPPEGWAKFVNNKGVPVTRRMNDAVQRRRAEADDLIQMLMLLDVNKVSLPKFVISDPDRVPNGTWSVATCDSSVQDVSKLMMTMQDVVAKFTETMNTVMQKMDKLEARLLYGESSAQDPLTDIQHHGKSTTAAAPAQAIPHTVNLDECTASTSWAEQVKSLAEAAPKLMSHRKPTVRLRGQASTTSVKGVPRQLTCFASRLHLDVTEEELETFLRDQGILDVKCRKLVAKDGRVFRTSAFRVSCSSRFESFLVL